MFDKLTQLSLADLQDRSQQRTHQEKLHDRALTGLLGLGTLLIPALVFAGAAAFARDSLHLAGALAFFTYAQLSFAAASRRTRLRRDVLVELFAGDQRRAQPAVPHEEVDVALQYFARRHRQLAWLEMVVAPLSAVAMAVVEVLFLMLHAGPTMSLFVWVAPGALLASIAVFALLLHRFDRLVVDTFQPADTTRP